MAGSFDGIKQRRFGVEIKMTGITRCSAAKAIQKVLGGSIDHVGDSYDKYKVGDSKGRKMISESHIRTALLLRPQLCRRKCRRT